MSQERIVIVDESAAVLLPAAVLERLGVGVGDLVDVSLEADALVIRSLNEAERRQRLEAATQDTFHRRSGAYVKLAEGHE
jgi:antitoxin component of MazEF toxin-antitoxin module